MTRGNEKCPCGSGLKFKRCCRNKGRDPETCRFCGRKEPEAKGEYVTLVSNDKSEEPGVFVCNDCYEDAARRTLEWAYCRWSWPPGCGNAADGNAGTCNQSFPGHQTIWG